MGGPYLYLFGIEEESIITESPKYKNWFSGHKLLYHKHTHTHTHGYCALRVPESDPGCLHAHTYTHANTHIYYVRTRIDVSLNLNIVLNMNPKSRCKPFKPEGLNQSEEGRPRMI